MKSPLKGFWKQILTACAIYLVMWVIVVLLVVFAFNQFTRALDQRGTSAAQELGNGVGQFSGEFTKGFNESSK